MEQTNDCRPRTWLRLFSGVMVIPWLIVLLLVSIGLHGNYVAWRYMAPYRALVARHATEKQVIAQEGKPHYVAHNNVEIKEWLQDTRPVDSTDIRTGGKVFIYCADPWYDGEGYVVYISFDRQGRAARTALAL